MAGAKELHWDSLVAQKEKNVENRKWRKSEWIKRKKRTEKIVARFSKKEIFFKKKYELLWQDGKKVSKDKKYKGKITNGTDVNYI